MLYKVTLRIFIVLVLVYNAISPSVWAGPYDPPANYYSSATGTGSTLKSQLHNIIDNHQTYSYDSARSILQITDEDPSDSDRMLLVYNRVSLNVSAINGGSIPGWDSGSSWNREHTWPKSRGVGTSGPDTSDLHQLRPSNPGVNSDRGNLNFGGAFGQSYGEVSDGGTFWYPGDADAGMIARQQFYMATRYDNSDSSTDDLELVAGNPASNGTTMGNLDRLLEWHYQAVPDNFELRRNDLIYDDYQGNRNPFVDRPGYVWSIFEDQQNDSQLYVGGSPAADGSSTRIIDLGPVIVGGSAPGNQNVNLRKNGNDGTYYEVTTSGDATSSVTGRYNAFAINTSGTDSTTISMGLSASTSTAGQQSGTVLINNLDVTTSGGTGHGANDGNDTVNLYYDVLDHSEGSFNGLVDDNTLLLDFGTVTLGSTLPTIDFDIFNLEDTAGFTAALELDSILGIGDSSVLTTNLTTFTGGAALAAGSSNTYTATLDTAAAGSFSASYILALSDEDLSGATTGDILTLNLVGTIEAPSFLESDFNEDTFVDTVDLVQWEGDYSLNDQSDANDDNRSDGLDFLVWQQQSGQSSLIAAVQTVPEPGSVALTLLGLCLSSVRRRRLGFC